MPDLLIELFSEEIPARMQARAAADLKRLITDGLVEAGVTYESAGAFVTPRRLALTVEGLLAQSPDTREERKGPRADAPKKAIEGFLRSTGLSRDQLEVRETKKGDVLFAVIERPGRPTDEIVSEVLERTIRNFPWPKSMRWGAGSLKWVRPLHSILCILSDEGGARIVPLVVDGIAAGDSTEGHRFMSPGRFGVSGFDDYAARLKKAHVLIDPQERAERIWHEATNTAFAQGFEVVEDKPLLAEVAGLVEWPVVLMGAISEEFLGLPPEVLQTSMREHQKFFSVKNPETGRIEKFVTVANRETADDGATIVQGNQKVLAARLADAKFFWENDLRVAEAGMGPWLDALENVTFHNKLGSQKDRIARIAALARDIAPQVGADVEMADQAARYAKADLSSEMVYEFPELQGVMGRYYLAEAGMSDAVARAAEEHYSPLGPSDDVPTAPVSVAVALADKIDLLAGFWSIDERPTGSKDPFALRRAALGVIRLVLENGLRLSLSDQFRSAAHILFECFSDVYNVFEPDGGSKGWDNSQLILTGYVRDSVEPKYVTYEKPRNLHEGDDEMAFIGAGDVIPVLLPEPEAISSSLLTFIHDRLKVHLRDRGIRHDVIDACIAMPASDDLTLLVKRAEALSGFLGTEDGENLLQGFKRANNILRQAEERDGVEYSYGADEKFLKEPAEKALYEGLEAEKGPIAAAIGKEDFASAMISLARLRAPIDAFFDAVQVNDENDVIRRNRLNLLSTIRALCLDVADLTRLEG